MKINSNTNDLAEKLSTSINNSVNKYNESEPVYVNSDVDNTYLKVTVNKVHLSESADCIKLSVNVLWSVPKDDRQTKDWIGYYRLG